MKMAAIKKKDTGEILAVFHFGQAVKVDLPNDEIEYTTIVVPENGEYNRLEPLSEDLAFDKVAKRFEKTASHFGVSMADFIETAAKAFGIPHCSTCELRKRILYAMDKLGKWRAFRLIWKTIRNKPFTPEEEASIKGIWGV